MASSKGGEPVHGDGPTAARGKGVPGSRGVAVWTEELGTAGVLQVTVSGPEGLQMRRLLRLLSVTDGIQVVGPAPAAGSPRRRVGDALVVALHEPADDGAHTSNRTALHAVRAVPVADRPQLSKRQVDVLTAYGRSNALLDVVARELDITPETLKTHLRRIRAKYAAVGRAAPTRRDLYVRAIEDGFLPPPG
jgi:DNA-binding CsgD family transcriptional regulator